MKILFLALITFTLFAFSTNKSINSPDISTEKMVKQVIQYKNGTTSTRVLSIAELEKLASLKEDPNVGNCTVQTPSGDCATTASSCNAALTGFGQCLCGRGFTNWCFAAPTNPNAPGVNE